MPVVTVLPDRLEIRLTAAERVLAFHRSDIVVDRANIRSATVTEDPWIWIRGIRAPGTAIPLTIAAGTWKFHGGKDFLLVKRREGSVVVDLVDEDYSRIIVSTRHAQDLIAALRLGTPAPAAVDDAPADEESSTGPDATGADPTRSVSAVSDPTDADPTDADPTVADLTGADLTNADPSDADPSDADPSDAHLTDADPFGTGSTTDPPVAASAETGTPEPQATLEGAQTTAPRTPPPHATPPVRSTPDPAAGRSSAEPSGSTEPAE